MSEAAGVGDILTGGVIAREVDRGGVAQGQAGDHAADGAGVACPNCGAVRAGPFCQQCGQSGHFHRNMMGLVHDVLHGVFHFEGKFWHTLPMLAWRPGELTRRYIHGERAKFVTPMAMFLFSIFLLFAAVNRLAMPDMSGAAAGVAKAKVQISQAAVQSARNIAKLQQERTARLAADPHAATVDLDKRIGAEQADATAMAKITRHLDPVEASVPSNGAFVTDGVKDLHSEIPWLDRQMRSINKNSALYAYKLKMASYKFSWALIPISVPFIWLLFFWRRDVGFYDHAIFAIHSLSFMTLLIVGLLVLYMVGVPQSWLWWTIAIVPPIHIYRHLKGAYRTGRFGALWRTFALLVMTVITSSLFFVMLLWLEAE